MCMTPSSKPRHISPERQNDSRLHNNPMDTVPVVPRTHPNAMAMPRLVKAVPTNHLVPPFALRRFPDVFIL